MQYKYCQNCGKKIPTNTKFCPNCGAKQIIKPKQHPKKPNKAKDKLTRINRGIKKRKKNKHSANKLNSVKKIKPPLTKHQQKKIAKKRYKQKHSLYTKKHGNAELFFKRAGIVVVVGIVLIVMIVIGTSMYQGHEHKVAENRTVDILKDGRTIPWKIGSGKFSDYDTDVNIMPSSDTYNISGGSISDNGNGDNDDDNSSQPASFKLNGGTISITDLTDALSNDDTLQDSDNTNQMIQNSSNGNSIKATVDTNKDDQDLVRGALKVQNDHDFVIFKYNSDSNQFIVFQKQ